MLPKKERLSLCGELSCEILYFCISQQVQQPKPFVKYVVVYPTPSQGEIKGDF